MAKAITGGVENGVIRIMGVSSVDVVDRHIVSRHKTGMQHRRILGDKAIQFCLVRSRAI
jgi:hypothetical protein